MDKSLSTPYPGLNVVLRDLVDSIRQILGSNFVGTYLQGSFAVGDFDLHSDVDFIVVTKEDLSPQEVDSLQRVHERIYCLDIPWAQHLEGSYFPQDVLRSHDRLDEQLWYLDHGSRSLIRSTHCNTVIVRRIVRDHGIALAGPPPATLVDPIPVETLRKTIMAVVDNLAQKIMSDPERFNDRFSQGFIVLGYCRMLHDLQRGYPGSKRAGAEWAKANLDPSWRGLIDRAWDCRPDPATTSRQRADANDFKATLAFVQYCTNKAHALY